MGDTACGVVRDGDTCLDVCVATRWTPDAIPPADDSVDIAAALDHRFHAVHMRGDRVGCSATAAAAAAAAADAAADAADAAADDADEAVAAADADAEPVDNGFVSYHALHHGSFGAHLLHSARGLARATAFNRTLVLGRLSLRPW